MTITVKELIEQLAELPPDLEVMVAQLPDDTFRPFTEVTIGFAVKEDDHHNYYGFYQEEYYDVDSETGESEYPGDNAVVLWPE